MTPIAVSALFGSIRRTIGESILLPFALVLTAVGALLAPAAAWAAEPLKLGVPPSASSRPTPVVPAPDQGVNGLPAPEMRKFVGPLSRPPRTGRAGVARWGAPGTAGSQRGPGDPDSVGWAGGGVAVEWGGPARGTSN